MPFSAEFKINTSKWNAQQKKIMDESVEEVFRIMGNVQSAIRRDYAKNTMGRQRISKFLGLKRLRKKARDLRTVTLGFEVDARHGRKRGAKLNDRVYGDEIAIWNSIVAQEETGRASGKIELNSLGRRFQGTIISTGKLMPIPMSSAVEGLTPSDFPEGRFVGGNKKSLVFKVGNRTLFIMKRQINVRKAKPFIQPTVLSLRKKFPKIMAKGIKELNIKIKGRGR